MVLWNRGEAAAEITCRLSLLKLPDGATVHVRNVWTRSDEPDASVSLSANVSRHDVKVLVLTPTKTHNAGADPRWRDAWRGHGIRRPALRAAARLSAQHQRWVQLPK